MPMIQNTFYRNCQYEAPSTPHLDPLPLGRLGRGEENAGACPGAEAAPITDASGLLSPLGGEDQGEGAVRTLKRQPLPASHRQVHQSGRAPLKKFIGPKSELVGQ